MSSPSNPFADEPLPELPGRLQSAASPLNPYAAPVSTGEYEVDLPPGVGIWRDGNCVVVHERARFPSRCLFTNEPEAERLLQTITWSYPIDWSSRKSTFSYGICQSALRKIRRQQIIALAVSGVSFLLLVLLFTSGFLDPNNNGWLVFFLAVLTIAALKISWDRKGLLVFQSIKQKYFWLKGPKRPFLDSLPKWPGIGHPT
ncbi:hypothetical protein NA78x_003002 [Anatilimnocola sp. NA78]|uniref:hypothetical protein n=1 Tax=Anatilimnocola sp. NA78 TaxID=3415683 RepID=UPI003CE479B2